MLQVDLNRLAREGTLLLETEISRSDPLWSDADVELDSEVRVRLEFTFMKGGGGVYARGTVRAEIRGVCRRCLDELHRTVAEDLELVFEPSDEHDAEADDGEVHLLDPTRPELDVAAVVREHFLLAVPTYLLCAEDCRGLCPLCGVNRNRDSCACSVEEVDPRWDALRALKE